jgi:drug/metabolite transporter (DMT)-like permease
MRSEAHGGPGTGSGPRPHALRSSLVLTLTALIWGMAFVAQRVGMESIGPFLFMGVRMFLGALTLLVAFMVPGLVAALRSLWRTGRGEGSQASETGRLGEHPAAPAADGLLPSKRLLLGGAVCGLVIFLAGSAQQVGLVFTPASKAGFLTALYIVLVPVLGIFLRHRPRWNTWLSVLVAAVGLYFLCMAGAASLQFGDMVVLVGAFFWACHILVVDHFVAGLGQREVMGLCIVQFAVAAALSLATAPFLDASFVTGGFEPDALLAALPAVLYTGILSTGVAFTLQAFGQQGLNPSAASLIMSLEAVFSVLGGALLLGEVLTLRELAGCAAMFAAVLLSQVPVGRRLEQ